MKNRFFQMFTARTIMPQTATNYSASSSFS